MATDSLPASCRDVLKSEGLRIIDVEHLSPSEGQHAGFDVKFNRFNDAWTKLAVFGLIEYERIILIDADMLFLRSMDELFDLQLPGNDWIAAAPACVCNPFKIPTYPSDWIPTNCSISSQSRYEKLEAPAIPPIDGARTSHLLNSGLVVLQPASSTMEALVEFLHTSPTVAASRFADQDVIAEAFHGKWKPLPWWTNALKPLRAVHPDVWADTEVRNIHYILDKPWDMRPSAIPATVNVTPSSEYSSGKEQIPTKLSDLVANSPSQRSVTEYEEVHMWWWTAYETLVGELKGRGDEVTWREMDRWIAQ